MMYYLCAVEGDVEIFLVLDLNRHRICDTSRNNVIFVMLLHPVTKYELNTPCRAFEIVISSAYGFCQI